MAQFSLYYQQSHDIDWFAKVGNIYVHAMSFGGRLPVEVNEQTVNTELLMAAYQIEVAEDSKAELFINNEYVDSRLSLMIENNTNGDGVRERYLRHFEEMAKRGFYSFDRDLNDERLYHMIVWPAKSIAPKWEVNNVPHLLEDGLDLNEGILRI